jgi:hypothetical protein
MSHAVTFRGQMDDDEQHTINLHTNNGRIGYRITKFQGMPKDPMTLDQENVLKIYKVKQDTVDGTVDFSDQTLLAALCVKYQADVAVGQGTPHMIAEHEIFNQDIYITHEDVASGNRPCNYYIELTQFKLTEHEAAVATMKDLRNNQSSS